MMLDDIFTPGESLHLAIGLVADCAFKRLLARMASHVQLVLAVPGESAWTVLALPFGILVSVVAAMDRVVVPGEEPFELEADFALLTFVWVID